jgi:hypothetical protein
VLEEVGAGVLRRHLDVQPLPGAVLLALLLPDLLPLGPLAQAGVLVAEGGEVRHVFGVDHGGQDGGEGGVALAEVVGGVELGHGLDVLVVTEGVGKLVDHERAGDGEPVALFEP